MRIDRSASLDKLPANLIPLKHACLEAYKEAFGEKLLAVYAVGSWVRGEMHKGSDTDSYAVLRTDSTPEEEAHLESMRQQLLLQWCPNPVSDVELDVLSLEDYQGYIALRKRTILQIDGCLLYGQDLPGDVFQEQSMTQIASSFGRVFAGKVNHGLDLNHKNLATRYRHRSLKAKFALRCMEWAAIIEGAPITSSMHQYVSDIQQFLPDLASQAAQAWTLYRKQRITDAELEDLEAVWQTALRSLLERGVNVPK
ncbi:MAG TPA: hypothetical protein VK674_04470 [Candidatus Limnocylindria bacterium]|nr:hypothetical protein [Candidatus Limnocylindria bacterium]